MEKARRMTGRESGGVSVGWLIIVCPVKFVT
jgi:hypothetical protein